MEVTLWRNHSTTDVKTGDYVKISNVSVGYYDKKKNLSTGQLSTIEVSSYSCDCHCRAKQKFSPKCWCAPETWPLYSEQLKVLVPINSLIPLTFFKHVEILVPKVQSCLEEFVCKILCPKSV